MGQEDRRKAYPPALVLGRPNANLLGQVRALGRQGVPIFCVLTRGEPPIIARLSRFVDRVVVVSHASDEKIATEIRKLSGRGQGRPVLFFGGDYDITLAARIWPQIRDYVSAATPPEKASEFNDKSRQVGCVLEANVPTPRTMVLRSKADVERALHDFALPVICRPVELARKGRFEEKMFLAANGEDLARKLNPILFEGIAGEVLIQEYIPGGNDQIYVALASCDGSGNPEAMVTARKLYEYPDGLMCIGETLENSSLAEVSRRVFRAFGVSGVLGVEFKYDPERDCFWFIEVNFRPDNFHAIAEGSGVNLMFHAYLRAIGKEEWYSGLLEPKRTVWRDISMVVLSRLSGQRPPVYETKGRRTIDAFWSINDPLPAIAWYVVKAWRAFRGLIGRRGTA